MSEQKMAVTEELVTMSLNEISEYPGNPRRITDEAVNALADSISRYGYQQPLVVDKGGVIVVGHTRFRALQKLGYTEVPVYVTKLPAAKVREYRLVDNKTGELSAWDHNALVIELREFEKGLLDTYFPHIDVEIAAVKEANVSQNDIEWGAKKALAVKEALPLVTVKVECPSCYHRFDVKASALPGISPEDVEAMAAAEGSEAS